MVPTGDTGDMIRSMRARALLGVFVSLAVVAAACGDSDDSSSTTTAAPATSAAETTEAPATSAAPTTEATTTTAPPTTATPTTAAPVMGVIEESFVGAPSNQAYGDEQIVDGDISVYWNNGSNGTLIAIYHGTGTADPTGLCPGNSLQTATGFQHVSNAPLTEGACEGFPTDVGSVRVCTGGVWLYETKIPNDSEGFLWGTIEKSPDGTVANISGLTGQAQNQAGTPVIDYSADGYTLSAMFTNDGSTEITCDAPLT